MARRRFEEQNQNWRDETEADDFSGNRPWNRAGQRQRRPYDQNQWNENRAPYRQQNQTWRQDEERDWYGRGQVFDSDYQNYGRSYNYGAYGQGTYDQGTYDQGYGRYGRDYYRDEYDRDFWRNYNRGQNDQDEARSYNRGLYDQEYRRDYNRGTYDQDYGRSYNRGQFDRDYERGYDRDEYPYENESSLRWDRGANENYPYNRGYGRGYGREYGYESRQNRFRQVPSAGMRSDYNTDTGYEQNRGFGEGFQNPHGRYSRSQGYPNRQDRSYGSGYGDYIGYENEGAFYQDLDEPYTYQYWEVFTDPETINEFTGVGPSGYHRSDERVMEEVCECLTEDGQIDAGDIEVFVNNGTVTLSGTVPNRQMRRKVEDIVENTFGVTNIQNEIKVRDRNRFADQGSMTGQPRDHDQEEQHQAPQNIPVAHQEPDTTTSRQNQSAIPGSEAQSSGPQNRKRNVRKGMEVVGKNGKVVGQVKEVRNNDFLVDRELARDVYVPFEAIQSVGAQAVLNVAENEIDDQNWETPNLI